MIDSINWLSWGTLVVFLGFILDWLAVYFNWQKIKLYSKPAAMALVIAWTLMQMDGIAGQPAILLLSAQLFGLAGDVFLLFPWRWFKWGLGAFLIGHLFYVGVFFLLIRSAFLLQEFSVGLLLRVVISLAALVLMVTFFYKLIKPDPNLQSLSNSLWRAVQAYAWLLSGMVAISILTVLMLPDKTWQLMPVVIGAGLFFISDSILAYDRFVRNLPKGRLWVRVTYHLAQFSIAWGLLMVMEGHKLL